MAAISLVKRKQCSEYASESTFKLNQIGGIRRTTEFYFSKIEKSYPSHRILIGEHVKQDNSNETASILAQEIFLEIKFMKLPASSGWLYTRRREKLTS